MSRPGLLQFVVPSARSEAATEPAPVRDGGLTRVDCESSRRGLATVGGSEIAVGGWGAYEADRRAALWELEAKPGLFSEFYPGLSVVGPDDAALSLVLGGRPGRHRPRPPALVQAASALSAALGQLEDKLCEPDDDGAWECAEVFRGSPSRARAHWAMVPRTVTIPPLTSADLREFIESPALLIDPEALYELGEAAGAVAASLGEALPPLPEASVPTRTEALPLPVTAPGPPLELSAVTGVPVSDDEAVMRLEAAVVGRVTDLEALQAVVATRLDQAEKAVMHRLAAPKKRSPSFA